MPDISLKPAAILKDGLETSFITQVLQDEQIIFKIEPQTRVRGLGSILGAPFEGFARLWCRPEDEEAVLAHLEDVRNSTVVEGKDYLVNGRMWRIKK